MSAPYVQCAPGVQVLLDTASADESMGVLYMGGKCARVTVVLQGTGTLSSGVIELDEAYYNAEKGEPQYAGTWSSLVTPINATAISGGAQQVVHITGSIWALRVRISTVLGGGGTLKAIAWGN